MRTLRLFFRLLVPYRTTLTASVVLLLVRAAAGLLPQLSYGQLYRRPLELGGQESF